jgi:hypothetical protein
MPVKRLMILMSSISWAKDLRWPTDPLEQVDIGDGSVPRPTFINQNLEASYKFELITLLKEYVDCFAWNYT